MSGGVAPSSNEIGAAALVTPVGVNKENSFQCDGQRAKRHSHKDNEDILFTYVWARQKAQDSYGGYTKYMQVKWKMDRPDMPMSNSALATKGKRLFDRASKDLGGKGWLYLDDLERIERKVTEEFARAAVSSGSSVEVCDPEVVGDVAPDGNEAVEPCESPSSQRPGGPEFMKLLGQASDLFQELKEQAVEEQQRCKVKKKSLSMEKQKWADWVMYDILGGLSVEEREDINIVNTAVYVIAIVFTGGGGVKHGSEMNRQRPPVRGKPKWQTRLEKKIAYLRKDVDVLKAYQEGRIKSEKAKEKVGCIFRRYSLDGEKKGIEKAIFAIKNLISVTANKIRRYLVRNKRKWQNKEFYGDRKRFYRSIFEKSQDVTDPPGEEAIEKFWRDDMWGQPNEFNREAPWIEEVRQKCEQVQEQEWSKVSESDVASQVSKQMSWKAPGVDMTRCTEK